MHITMVKKRLIDGTECRKCIDAVDHLKSRGLWDHIDEIVWAEEEDATSAGMVLATHLAVDKAPFFIVRHAGGEAIYTSVLQLVRERLGQTVSAREQVEEIDPDEIGGI